MFIFLLVYFISILLMVLADTNKNKYIDKFCLFIITFLLSFLQGFRALSVGTDTLMYTNILESDLGEDSYFSKNLEFGYLYVNKLFQELNLENYFFLVLSFFANLMILSTIFSLGKNRFIVFISFISFSGVYLMGFNILRQFLATSLFICSIKLILREKYLLAFLFVVSSFLFHYSSFFYIIIFLLYFLIYKGLYKTALSTAFLFPFLYNFIWEYIVLFLLNLTGKQSFENYIGRSQDVSSGFWFFAYSLIFIYLCIFFKRNIVFSKFLMCIVILWYSLYINIAFLGLAYEGPGRVIVCTYFSIVLIFGYLNYGSYKILHYLFLLIIFTLIFFYMYVMKGAHQIFPYQMII